MKKSYFFLTVILVLFFGAWKMQLPAHNQEVVLEYSDEQITSNKVRSIVQAIREELNNYGIENVLVYEDENGVLKISYYSEEDVQTIKANLESLALIDFFADKQPVKDEGDLNLQLKKEHATYKLEVFEIQESINGHSGLGGKVAIVVSDEFSKPNTTKSFTALNKKSTQKYLGRTYESSKIFGNRINYLSKASNLIPDVRAGPNFS